MEIKTERLRLRTLMLGDLDKVHELHSIPETDHYNTLGIPTAVEQTRSIVFEWMDAEKEPRKRYTFYVEDYAGYFVGLFGLVLGKPRFRNLEMWFKFHPNYWNRGYATEAVKNVLEFCFNELNMHRVEAGCATGNRASARVMEKAGMTREGIKRKNLPIRGEWVDAYMYSILKEEYNKR